MPLAGAATSRIFVATKVCNTCLSRQIFVVTSFVATNIFCCDKHAFVAASMLLSPQNSSRPWYLAVVVQRCLTLSSSVIFTDDTAVKITELINPEESLFRPLFNAIPYQPA